MKIQGMVPLSMRNHWPCLSAKLVILGAFAVGSALSQNYVFEPIPPALQPNSTIVGLNTTTGILHAKSSADEWFCNDGGSGVTLGQVDPSGNDVQVPFDLALNPNPNDRCQPGGEYAGGPRIPKVNQGYVWGSALVGNYIYFGTTANGECVTTGSVLGGTVPPYNAGPWTCQFGDSPLSPFPLPASIGDNRPPRFYVYNIATGVITDISPKMGGSPPASICGTYTSTNPYCLDPLWYTTRGIRAVTSYTETQGQGAGHTYVIASGPALVTGSSALNYFAYDTTLNKWVAEAQLTGYNDQRHWVKDGYGNLYAPTGKPGTNGGGIIRYYGNFQVIPPAPTPSGSNSYGQIPFCGAGLVTGPPAPGAYACFDFANVGDIDGVGTDATIHEGRIFVATWTPPGLAPNVGSCTPTGCQATINGAVVPYPYAGLWMSPAIPTGGLTSANAGPSGGWTKPWNALKYEPDPVMATAYDTGAIIDYNGVLYFGTMNVAMTSSLRLWQYYGEPTNTSIFAQYFSDSWRPCVMFTGNGFTTGTPQINILYGASQLYVYSPGPNVNSGTFTLTNNNMGGAKPLYGAAGFNNAWNSYIWSMGIWNSRLYVGTMDWSYTAAIRVPQTIGQPVPNINTLIPPAGYGADLWFFPNTTSAAQPESTNGVGNNLNLGIRNIIPYTYPNGSISMFIGTANPMNLATTGPGPYGGWELIELKAASTVTKR
jgi:hypothetical protein